jgi:hypothetical protein
MRNKFPGVCYRCGKLVEPGDGHFERFLGGWRTQHASCAIKFRGTPSPVREAARLAQLKQLALGTGRPAQRARRQLRDMENGKA